MGNPSERPPFSLFVERTNAPREANVRRVLSRAREAWDYLVEHLEQEYGLKHSWHFMYGARYGWAMRFDHRSRLVLALYPNQDCFTVQIILPPAQEAEAVAAGLPSFVVAVLERAKKYPEGRWLFIPIESLAQAREIRPLIALKLQQQGVL